MVAGALVPALAPKLIDGPCESADEKLNPVDGLAGCAKMFSVGLAAAPNPLFVGALAPKIEADDAAGAAAPNENPVLALDAAAAGAVEAPKLKPPAAGGLAAGAPKIDGCEVAVVAANGFGAADADDPNGVDDAAAVEAPNENPVLVLGAAVGAPNILPAADVDAAEAPKILPAADADAAGAPNILDVADVDAAGAEAPKIEV